MVLLQDPEKHYHKIKFANEKSCPHRFQLGHMIFSEFQTQMQQNPSKFKHGMMLISRTYPSSMRVLIAIRIGYRYYIPVKCSKQRSNRRILCVIPSYQLVKSQQTAVSISYYAHTHTMTRKLGPSSDRMQTLQSSTHLSCSQDI